MNDDLKEKLLLTGAFLLVILLGFYAGRISVKIDAVQEEPMKDIGQISSEVPTINFTSFDKGMLYGKSNGKDLRIFVSDQIVQGKEDRSFFIDTSSIKNDPVSDNGEKYLFVASKNSNKYHPIGSSAANRINAENKIYFTSQEEAKKKGFEPASDVK